MLNKIFLSLIISFFVFSHLSLSQDSTKESLAFKKNRRSSRAYTFYQPDLAYRIWQQFSLVKEANDGNPQAQHELGLRYLLGQDVPSDTLRGAYWLKKAADKNYSPALFNYGILLFNGWGVSWNPYMAFDYFKRAAEDNMSQAQLLLGLLYTDDLVTPKDLKTAYKWVKQSADNGYEPAKAYLQKLSERTNLSDTASSKNKTDEKNKEEELTPVTSGLVYIDFDTAADTIAEIKYSDLIEDLLNSPAKDLPLTVKKGSDSINYLDKDSLYILQGAALYGAPEAISFTGWLYEHGEILEKNLTEALLYYARGAELESRRSMLLLWHLLNKPETMQVIKSESDAGNTNAMVTWYLLYKLKLERRITEQDALNLLDKAASLNNSYALFHEGVNYYSGIFVEVDKIKAVSFWEKASALGNADAEIRLESAKLLEKKTGTSASLDYLVNAAEKGSLFAEAVLADYYKMRNELTKSVYYYRSAAMRGSTYAYNGLKDLYMKVKEKR